MCARIWGMVPIIFEIAAKISLFVAKKYKIHEIATKKSLP